MLRWLNGWSSRSTFLLGLTLSVSGWQSAQEVEMASPRIFPLPAPALQGALSVEDALRQRRSEREFAPDSLSLREVGQLLWAAQGTTGDGHRTAPSAGAMYPLELYVAVGNVGDLPVGVYHYRPAAHELRRLTDTDLRQQVARAALDQSWMADAPVIVVITADYARTTGKYGARGRQYVHMEVGHVAQNLYLQSQALGLATTMVGAFREREIAKILGLPDDHAPLALMPVGTSR